MLSIQDYFRQAGNTGVFEGFEPKTSQAFLETGKGLSVKIYSKLSDAADKASALCKTKEFGEETIRMGARTFARWASAKTPPNAGSISMYSGEQEFEKLFYRPILFLPKLVRGEIKKYTATGEDVSALRNGFTFKVLDTRGRHEKTRCYTKTKEEALQQARIIYRGINRAAWGLNLHMIGAKDIPNITRLLKDSPDIANQGDISQFYWRNEGDFKYVDFHNRAQGIKVDYKRRIASSAQHYAFKAMTTSAKKEGEAVIRKALNEAKLELATNEMRDWAASIYGYYDPAPLNDGQKDEAAFSFLTASNGGSLSGDRFSFSSENGRFNFQLR